LWFNPNPHGVESVVIKKNVLCKLKKKHLSFNAWYCVKGQMYKVLTLSDLVQKNCAGGIRCIGLK